MSRLPELPTTFAEAHDLLQSMFGIGSYDEYARPDPPYYKARMNEIAVITAVSRKRRVTPEQLGQAAWYAHRTGVHVRQALRLFPLIPMAQREWRKALAAEAAEAAQAVRDDLIQEALDAGEQEWAERFVRAAPAEVPNLTEKWRTR